MVKKDDTFETFDRYNVQIKLPMEMTIYAGGKFAFNRTANDLIKTLGWTKVVLSFDRKNQIIGIRAPRGIDEAVYRLSTSHGNRYSVFCSYAFYNFIEFPNLKHAKAFPAEWDREHQRFLVKLIFEEFKEEELI